MTSNGVERQAYSPQTTEYLGRTGRVYTIDTFHSSGRNGFVEVSEFEPLVSEIRDLYLATYPNRNREMSLERVMRMLSHPRTLLMLAKHEGIPVGFGVFPRFYIDNANVLYSSRAFITEHESQGLGTYVLDLAMQLHNEELRSARQRPLIYGALYTQNAASLATIERSDNTDNIRPLLTSVSKAGGRYQMSTVPKATMRLVHASFLTNTAALNDETGVCAGELRDLGINQSFIPGRSELADRIYREFTDPLPRGLGMDISGGDVVIVVYDIKVPNSSTLLM